jgi:hypothetical protein
MPAVTQGEELSAQGYQLAQLLLRVGDVQLVLADSDGSLTITAVLLATTCFIIQN